MCVRIKETFFGRLFCFCCSVRTGASVIGWFNFIFNSLYVATLLFALARMKEEIEPEIEFYYEARSNISMIQLNAQENSEIISNFEGSGVPPTHPPSKYTDPYVSCSNGDYHECLCNGEYVTDIVSCSEKQFSSEFGSKQDLVEYCLCENHFFLYELVFLL